MIASKANSVIYVQHQRKYENKIPFYLKKYVNYPTKYLVISKSIKNNVLELLKINSTKILLLHNWINTNHNRININKKNLENYDLNILWFGRILPWKGIDTIVDLGEILKKNELTFKFHIYGDFYNEHYEEKICNKIKLLGFEKLYKFYGNKSQSEIFSKKYDLFLHTSIKPEPFGRTIIESMYNEIPVIATNMGGVRDIIIDNYNGFVYNINNYEKIISSIKYLMTDNQKEEIILNAKKTIFQKFSEKSQSQIINKFYNEISDEKKN